MTKAFIYTRRTEGNERNDGDLCINQSIRCLQYAKDKGYEVVHVFHEDGDSGRDCWNTMIGWIKYYAANNHEVRLVMDSPKILPTSLRSILEISRCFGLIGGVDFEFVDGFIEPETDKPGLYEREETLSSIDEHMSNREVDRLVQTELVIAKAKARAKFKSSRVALANSMKKFIESMDDYMEVFEK